MKELDLSGDWEMLPVERFDDKYDKPGWLQTTVPGHWQMNKELEFYGGKMVYRKRFKFKAKKGERYRLRLNGVFYWSIAYLNGCRVGENEGYFFPRDYDITDVLKADNELLIEVDCPDEPDKRKKRLLTGVFSHWDCLDPKTNPGGIWLPVEIYSSGDTFISECMTHTAYYHEKYARIEARVSLNSTGKRKVKIRLTFKPHNFDGKEHVHEQEFVKGVGVNNYLLLVNLPDYELWWTWDHGPQNLYDVKAEVIEEGSTKPSDTVEYRFGVRTFELRDYIPYLNRKRIFIRGNNYPPGDTRISTMTRERYEKDFELILGCNINMIRMHAHVEHPEFYEVADEKGIIVWQDFPMQWAYIKEVYRPALYQVERMVKHLFNHPSIGVWCMHNEPMHVTDTKNIKVFDVLWSVFNALFYGWNREVLDEKLKERTLSIDTSRFVTKCSGMRGVFREPGDEHFYFGWYPPFYRIRNFEFVRKYMRRSLKFITEFGAQSFPNLESSKKFMDEDIKKVDWKHLEARHHYQPSMMRMWVKHKDYGSLEDFIKATQQHQINVNQYHIDRLRFHKYKPVGGITPFMFIDSNPCIQWSLVDYWRVPKKSYYSMQKCMNPQYAFTLLEKDVYKPGKLVSVPLFTVNDQYERFEDAKVKLDISDPDGDNVASKEYTTILRPDAEAEMIDNFSFKAEKPGIYNILITLDYGGKKLENPYTIEVK